MPEPASQPSKIRGSQKGSLKFTRARGPAWQDAHLERVRCTNFRTTGRTAPRRRARLRKGRASAHGARGPAFLPTPTGGQEPVRGAPRGRRAERHASKEAERPIIPAPSRPAVSIGQRLEVLEAGPVRGSRPGRSAAQRDCRGEGARGRDGAGRGGDAAGGGGGGAGQWLSLRRGRSSRCPSSKAHPGLAARAAKTAGRPGAGRRALCCGLRWWGAAGRGGGPGPGVCGWEALWGVGARAAAGAMAEGGGGARRRAPALLEAARARYESLHISDDVFGESGPDSGGNPFYSTSAASHSSSAASSDDERERPAPPGTAPPPQAADPLELEEDEAGGGWSAALRDRPPPRFEDTGGEDRPGHWDAGAQGAA